MAIGPGDIVCAFSDGITEAMDEKGEQFGYKQLCRTVSESAGSPVEVVKSIQEALRKHTGSAPQSDDLTLVCFGRTNHAAPS